MTIEKLLTGIWTFDWTWVVAIIGGIAGIGGIYLIFRDLFASLAKRFHLKPWGQR